MAVEQRGGLVRHVPHETARERRQVGDAGRRERLGDEPEGRPGGGAVGDVGERERPARVPERETAVLRDDDGGRVAGRERGPSPALRALDALEQDARTLCRQRGEHADRRRDVRQQLRPDGNERPRLGRCVERLAIGVDPHGPPSVGRSRECRRGTPARQRHRRGALTNATGLV